MWLKFDFPVECVADDWWKSFFRRSAAKSSGGGCCPYLLCRWEIHYSCESKTAEECARRCKEFYEKHIKGGEK